MSFSLRDCLRKLPCLMICLLSSTLLQASDPSLFRFSNPPGPFSVGFEVVRQYDYSRTYSTSVDLGKPGSREGARPLQTVIWYPAKDRSDLPITYGDYLELFASEDSFLLTPAQAADTLHKEKIDYRADADPSVKMWATKSAKPNDGKFPLIIYAPSFGGPAFENADLCEYLATYGYVVIATPSIGAHSFNMSGGMEGAETQARDISFLIDFACAIPQTDLSHIAVIGYSWGGISNFFAAAIDSRITALIAIDGSARYFPKLIKDSGYVRPQDMTIPLLFFTRGEITLESLKGADLSGNVLNEMIHSNVYIVRMHDMRHGEFSSMHQRSPAYWKSHPPGEYSPEETSDSYKWMARYTLEFLNWTFKQDASAQTFLENPPAKNGVPNHMLALDFHSSTKP